MFPTNRIERIFNIKGQDRVQIVTRIGVLMQVSLRQGRYRMEHVSSTIPDVSRKLQCSRVLLLKIIAKL